MPAASIIPGIDLGSLYNPAAYGTKPIIPATSTDTTKSSSTWTSDLVDYASLAPQASEVTMQQMEGQLPDDVMALLGQAAAERGVGAGYPGSPSVNAAYLRALGLTSLDMQQKGIANYLNLLAQSPRTTTGVQDQIKSNNVLAAITAAGADPYAKAMAELAAAQMGLQAGGGAAEAMTGTPGAAGPGGGGYTLTGGAPAFTSGQAANIGTGADAAQAAWNAAEANRNFLNNYMTNAAQQMRQPAAARTVVPDPYLPYFDQYAAEPSLNAWQSPFSQPASSVFGETGIGYDVFNPANLPVSGFGQMPDYSQPTSTSFTGFGLPSGYEVPEGTYYNPTADTYTTDPWAEFSNYYEEPDYSEYAPYYDPYADMYG